MMRSLKVHQLSDQFSKVMTCFHYFFLLLYSKFYLQVHFLIPSSNNLLTLFDFFFFFVRLFWNFKFFFNLQFFACPSVSINVISNIAQCAMTTWQSITSLISIIEIDELNTQVLYKPICLMVLFVECALKAVVSIITLY